MSKFVEQYQNAAMGALHPGFLVVVEEDEYGNVVGFMYPTKDGSTRDGLAERRFGIPGFLADAQVILQIEDEAKRFGQYLYGPDRVGGDHIS